MPANKEMAEPARSCTLDDMRVSAVSIGATLHCVAPAAHQNIKRANKAICLTHYSFKSSCYVSAV
jgi:hypothetical protein